MEDLLAEISGKMDLMQSVMDNQYNIMQNYQHAIVIFGFGLTIVVAILIFKYIVWGIRK